MLSLPFSWIPSNLQWRVFSFMAGLTLVIASIMSSLDKPLQNDQAPYGIVSFELAGHLDDALAILDSWGPQEKISAGLSLGFDYFFIICYVVAIGLGCFLAGKAIMPKHRLIGGWSFYFSWSLILAGMLDAFENLNLIKLLLGNHQAIFPVLAFWAACVKFLLILLGIVYFFVAIVLSKVLK